MSQRRNSSEPSKRAASPSWPKSPEPTPYEILGIERGAEYNKANFNRLVKLYHPDLSGSRHVTGPGHLSQAVRLDRYRLVIAAHNLLSDPHKRRLYDESHNPGWMYPSPFTSDARTRTNRYTWSRSERILRRDGPISPLRQRPLYTSNAAFAMLLVALSILAAVLQMKRVVSKTRRDSRRLQMFVSEALQEEIQAWASVLQGQSRDDRVLAFLARRHGVPQQLLNWATAHGGKIGNGDKKN
ncbi:hypothetical protein EsDP_00005132 [Epichloe bromicola]|uniref:J domain-containing protein n=1 Tax=Epichloe bromicola TaxID=79588 RepID=A0ABQ0CTR6_9HYPO